MHLPIPTPLGFETPGPKGMAVFRSRRNNNRERQGRQVGFARLENDDRTCPDGPGEGVPQVEPVVATSRSNFSLVRRLLFILRKTKAQSSEHHAYGTRLLYSHRGDGTSRRTWQSHSHRADRKAVINRAFLWRYRWDLNLKSRPAGDGHPRLSCRVRRNGRTRR